MVDLKNKLHKLIDDLDDEKQELVSRLQSVKKEGLKDWDKVEDIFEKNLKEGTQSLKVKAHLAKLNLLEGWDKVVDKIDETKPSREELRVRMHLAKLELLDEWDEAEEKIKGLKKQADTIKHASEEKLEPAWELGKKMGKEIRLAFSNISSKK